MIMSAFKHKEKNVSHIETLKDICDQKASKRSTIKDVRGNKFLVKGYPGVEKTTLTKIAWDWAKKFSKLFQLFLCFLEVSETR